MGQESFMRSLGTAPAQKKSMGRREEGEWAGDHHGTEARERR